MTNEELIRLIQNYRDNSLGADDSALSVDRAEAMDRYYGRPYGDEEDGKSKIVSKDLSETVDWIMPAIMKSLMYGGELAEFLPIGPEDEDDAIQESQYVNHVLMSDNDGFIVLYDAIRDALLLKNGYWKHYWDESDKITEREYANLTQPQLVKLFSDLAMEGAEVEVLEQEEETQVIGEGLEAVEIPIFHIKLKITRKVNRLRVEAIPPEEMRIHKNCRGSLQTSDFTEHVTTKTRTGLIEMGLDEDFVYSLPSYNDDDEDIAVQARNSIDEETEYQDSLTIDRSMDEIEYCEAYVRVDHDGDGKAELRRIVSVGGKIPPGDDWNEIVDSVAMTGVVSKRVPHRHIGESLHDDLDDLMRMKTFLYRQMYDNVYSTNNNETVVNNRVHIPDWLQSNAAGIKRINDDSPVGDSVMQLAVQPIVPHILPAIEVLDRIKAGRTGISEVTTVQDPNVLRDSTNAAFQQGLQQAGQKVEMIERMLVESGVKELILRIHELLIKHQDIPRKIKLSGQFVEINPSQWRDRTDLKVKVGLGSGTQDEKRKNLMLLAQIREEALQQGLITPQETYRFYADMAKTLGELNPDKYVMDPATPEYQQLQQERAQQQSNPLAEAEQVKGAMELQKQQLQGQFNLAMQQQEIQNKAQIQELERDFKARLELYKTQSMEAEKQADRESKEAIEMLKGEIELLKAGMNKDIGQPGIGAELG